MLQFAQSIALWAAAGIIVPVIIHLWNIKEGKTLKVGSIAFLTESAKTQSKSLKLSQLLLLLLRCVLLIVLAMLIARPFLNKDSGKQKEKGWILVSKNKVNEVYKRFGSTIDTLVKTGYTFHYFDREFNEVQLEEALKTRKDSINRPSVSYWTLLKELDQKVPPTLPVQLFTDNRVSAFSGERPTISMNLTWHTYRPTDTLSTCIKKAYTTADDSIRVVVSNNGPTADYNSYYSISTANANKQFSLKAINGQLHVAFTDTLYNKCRSDVEVDTSTIVVAIFSRNAEDANYTKAALNAVKDFTKYRIKVSAINDVQHIPANYTWLFWLSEEAIPTPLIRNNVFLYEKGKIENIHSTLITGNSVPSSAANNILIYKNIATSNKNKDVEDVVWKTGFAPVLLHTYEKNASIYHFYSRFNPQWSDLVWSEKFPEIIYHLIFSTDDNLPESDSLDRRIMDSTQIKPVTTSAKNLRQKQDLLEKKDLSKVWWILAFVLFILERIFAWKFKKEEVYG